MVVDKMKFGLQQDKTNRIKSLPREDWDQPGLSLLCILWVAQDSIFQVGSEYRSVLADAQADQCLFQGCTQFCSAPVDYNLSENETG